MLIIQNTFLCQKMSWLFYSARLEKKQSKTWEQNCNFKGTICYILAEITAPAKTVIRLQKQVFSCALSFVRPRCVLAREIRTINFDIQLAQKNKNKNKKVTSLHEAQPVQLLAHEFVLTPCASSIAMLSCLSASHTDTKGTRVPLRSFVNSSVLSLDAHSNFFTIVHRARKCLERCWSV